MPYSRPARDAQPEDEISGRYAVDPHAETETSLAPITDSPTERLLLTFVGTCTVLTIICLIIVVWANVAGPVAK